MSQQPLLFELSVEELPTSAPRALSEALGRLIEEELSNANLGTSGAPRLIASPRHLGFYFDGVESQQADQSVQRRGPAVQAAFKPDGTPTPAATGFARSCGVEVDALSRKKTDKGEWLLFESEVKGKSLEALLPDMLERALAKLPIAKRMRWGNTRTPFVRPVHHVVLMLGDKVLEAEFFGQKAGNTSFGRRNTETPVLTIASAERYFDTLSQAGIEVDFDTRKAAIKATVLQEAEKFGATTRLDGEDADLLEEVTAYVEYPVALCGEFDVDFLEVPEQALISSMKGHQKYFPMFDAASGKLLPRFITVANLSSKNPTAVIEGNERVIRPRLADAKFFFTQDLKTPLEAFLPKLGVIVYQKQLGTIGDKVRRISSLAGFMAAKTGADKANAEKTGLLCKADLVSEMVLEFPELQGYMGGEYAKACNEPDEVAAGIAEHYQPVGPSDDIPPSASGQLVALADKIDTLIGIFGIGQPPSGTKDPYALRRAALGLIRILQEAELGLDLAEIFAEGINQYQAQGVSFKVENLELQLLSFIQERYPARYADKGISRALIQGVQSLNPSRPLDFDRRLKALSQFSEQPEAESLSAAHKRVSNLLAKYKTPLDGEVDVALLAEDPEKALFSALELLEQNSTTDLEQENYAPVLTALGSLKTPVDTFFNDVLVNAEDDAIKHNRYQLLYRLDALMTKVADIACLNG